MASGGMARPRSGLTGLAPHNYLPGLSRSSTRDSDLIGLRGLFRLFHTDKVDNAHPLFRGRIVEISLKDLSRRRELNGDFVGVPKPFPIYHDFRRGIGLYGPALLCFFKARGTGGDRHGAGYRSCQHLPQPGTFLRYSAFSTRPRMVSLAESRDALAMICHPVAELKRDSA